MESIFVIKKKMKLLQKASILRTVLKKHFKGHNLIQNPLILKERNRDQQKYEKIESFIDFYHLYYPDC